MVLFEGLRCLRAPKESTFGHAKPDLYLVEWITSGVAGRSLPNLSAWLTVFWLTGSNSADEARAR